LVAAAADTALLAQDVTTSLKDRLEDYVSQINSTAMLLSDALLLVNSEGIIESFNPAAERIFGWAKETMLGQHISTLFKLDNG
ncbi:PAS domain S-box protein, partial [Escherichia coli]|uniref:PAS domain S-box protein n=1 Tax=Escherichia coli TaxID=562 RepID=UPI000E20D27C